MKNLAFASRIAPTCSLLAALLSACSPNAEPRGRFINLFRPDAPRHWVPASEYEVRQQKAPMMLIHEVTEFPDPLEPTPAQRAAAVDLVARTLAAAKEKGWFDHRNGVRDGYSLMFGDEVHYVNREYALDDVILDPERPEFLMYYDTDAGKVLAGVMFYTRSIDEWGPQIGGPLTVWHFHTWNREICLAGGIFAVALPENGHCPLGIPSWRSPQMMHVWLLDHPDGPFASSMKLDPDLLKQLIAKRGH